MRKIKKAFTLIELLVVIAILAVLTTIGIITYRTTIDKSNDSSDNSLIAQLNESAKLYTVNKTINTVTDIANYLENNGFDLTRVENKSDNFVFAFDIINKEFFKVDISSGEPIDYSLSNKEDGFVFVKNMTDFNKYQNEFDYSIYCQEGEFSEDITIVNGIDVGNNDEFTSITYANSSTIQDVVIRTNSYETALLINDKSEGTISHYDLCGSVNIIECHTASYHEYGVISFIEISEGHLSIEKGASVEHVHIDKDYVTEPTITTEGTKKSSEFATCEVSVDSSVETPVFSRDSLEEIGVNGTVICTLDIAGDTQIVKINKDGIYEQSTVAKPSQSEIYVDISNASESTKVAVNQLVNTYNDRDATTGEINDKVFELGENTVTVTFDKTTRDFVTTVKNTQTGEEVTDSSIIDSAETEAETKIDSTITDGGLTEEQKVSEKDKIISPHLFRITHSISQIGDGETYQFVATGGEITWSSSDEEVATIDEEGNFVAVDPGTVTITANCYGSEITCEVAVMPFHEIIVNYGDPFVIANEQQLENYYYYFMYNNKTYYTWDNYGYDYDTIVRLEGNIDLSKVTVPSGATFAEMIFDGNGYTISNGTKPLFNCNYLTGNVTIKNLTLNNFVSNTGLFTFYGEYAGNISFENVDLINCTAKGGCGYIPYAYYSNDIVSIKDCDVTNCTINDNNGAQGYIGIYVGNSKNGVTIDNCIVSNTTVTGSKFSVGGIIGSSQGTIKNCIVKSNCTVEQKGSSSVTALGGGTRTDNKFYGIVKSASKSQMSLQDSEGVWVCSNPIATSDDFVLNSDGSITYSGEETLSKIVVQQKYTQNNLKDGVFASSSSGYQANIEESVGRIFTNIVKDDIVEEAYLRITNIRHVGAAHPDALNYNLEELPTGLEFNSREVAVDDDGVLYIDSSVHNECYESYVSGGASGQTGEISITLFIEIYDAQDELLTTVTMGYTFQPTV